MTSRFALTSAMHSFTSCIENATYAPVSTVRRTSIHPFIFSRFLDGLHLALSAHFVYYYLVVNYDNPSALLHMIWSFKVTLWRYTHSLSPWLTSLCPSQIRTVVDVCAHFLPC